MSAAVVAPPANTLATFARNKRKREESVTTGSNALATSFTQFNTEAVRAKVQQQKAIGGAVPSSVAKKTSSDVSATTTTVASPPAGSQKQQQQPVKKLKNKQQSSPQQKKKEQKQQQQQKQAQFFSSLAPAHPSLNDEQGDAEDAEGDDDGTVPAKRTRREMARVAAPSPGTKRCCKKDLIRSLRVGEILVVTRVEQHYLDEYNNGEKIRARFTGQDFYDLSKNTTYRSLSQWVKKRLVDVGALGVKSNISGWDFVAVERDGRKEGLRMLVDEDEEEDEPSDSPGQRPSPPSSKKQTLQNNKTALPELSIAQRMAQLCQQPESSSSASSSPGTIENGNASNSPEQAEITCNLLREELARTRIYVEEIEQKLNFHENRLKALRQKHEYGLRERTERG